ncbi:MAG: purine-nucleoside phosphorylase [Candidatus Cloacimonetes bacterium]|nr:purine-nucleoside phosphorylase [Candidatus Cloacimonadota bacterium]
MIKRITQAVEYIRTKTNDVPETALILGTGLNSIADMIKNPILIPYKSIPNFPASTAPSHVGKMIVGDISGKKVIILQGRVHFYEGYSMQEVTFPIRVLNQLGVKNIIITNAAGSLNENLVPGNIALITDHINFMGANPLIGENYDDFGERFPSMHEPYNQKIRKLAMDIAFENNFIIKEGIYVAVAGPSLETTAECKMLITFGADLVGMSTVPEVIAAIHGGMNVLGISIVTNLSNVFHSEPHSQEEIRKNAAQAKSNLKTLIQELIKRM